MSEISSTEARCYDDVRPLSNKSHISLSPFTEKTLSPFTLAAKPGMSNVSPKKSPLSSLVMGISRTSCSISDAGNFPADRRVSGGSSFMKSDHISRLNFNSVSTTSTSADQDSAALWLGSFTEVQTPGGDLTSPPHPAGSFTSPLSSLDDDSSPPVLKLKVRQTSRRTPDKSPLVTSSSGDVLELVKPSAGLEQLPVFVDSDGGDFEANLSHRLTASDSRVNSTSRKLSTSIVDSDLDEWPLYDQLPTKTTKQTPVSRNDRNSCVRSENRNSSNGLKQTAKDKLSSKSGSRPSKQKSKLASADLHEKQRSEQNDAFEAACRLPSTVMGQLRSAADTRSNRTKRRSTFDSCKVSWISLPLVMYH